MISSVAGCRSTSMGSHLDVGDDGEIADLLHESATGGKPAIIPARLPYRGLNRRRSSSRSRWCWQTLTPSSSSTGMSRPNRRASSASESTSIQVTPGSGNSRPNSDSSAANSSHSGQSGRDSRMSPRLVRTHGLGDALDRRWRHLADDTDVVAVQQVHVGIGARTGRLHQPFFL
jgi:hypothetical protein